MSNIALFQLMLDVRSRRGPDVFFPMFFGEYERSTEGKNRIYYFVKTDNREGVIAEFQKIGLDISHVIFLDLHHSRFKSVLDNFQLFSKLIRYRINVLHLLTYIGEEEYLHFLKFIKQLPRIIVPKLAFTVTYNGIPTAFEKDYDKRFAKDRAKYGKLFSSIQFDGILTWYDSFRDFALKHPMFSYRPIVYSIKSRFCDYSRFHPIVKEKIIMWASALVNYKGPMMFLQAIDILYKKEPLLFIDWKIVIAGSGPMESEMREFILSRRLSMCELITDVSDISELLNRSMCYVSTQEIDNFPSLAMNEAMGAGNVIIARNVGRTDLFVKEGKNGFLTKTDDATGLAESIGIFLKDSSNHKTMMDHSIHLTKTVHTPSNFIRQMDEFWGSVIRTK